MTDPLGWSALVAHATLGTGRRPTLADGTIAGVDLPVDAVVEQALLHRAAVLGAGRRTARLRRRASSVEARDHAHAPPDRLPVAPEPAAELLGVLLSSGLLASDLAAVAVDSWLRRAAQVGVRVPAAMLTSLLGFAHGPDGEIRVDPVALVRAVGVRGRWLAAANPRWTALGIPEVVLDDPTGEGDVALAALRGLRLPPNRRAAVLQVVRALSPVLAARWLPHLRAGARRIEHQVAIVRACASTATPHDEGWLESWRAEGGDEVAHAASLVLRTIPGSALRRRQAERLRPLIDLTGRRQGRPAEPIVVVEPDVDGPDWAGLVADATTPPGQPAGRWGRAQLLAGADLGLWAQLGSSPARTFRRVPSVDVGLGLAVAAAVQRDRGWHRAALDWVLSDHGGASAAEVRRAAEGAPSPQAATVKIDAAHRRVRGARAEVVRRLLEGIPPVVGPERTADARVSDLGLEAGGLADVAGRVLDWAMANPDVASVLPAIAPALARHAAPDMLARLRAHEGDVAVGPETAHVHTTLSSLRHVIALGTDITERLR